MPAAAAFATAAKVAPRKDANEVIPPEAGRGAASLAAAAASAA